MRKVIRSRMLKKMLILAVLCGGLIFLGHQNSNIQTVEANPCCSSCTGGGDPIDAELACEDECGSYSNSCYNNCINQANSCLSVCSSCGGGTGNPAGPGGSCYINAHCNPGYDCINRVCQ